MSSPQKHHHIVSQGYLRQFARRASGPGGRSDFYEVTLIRKAAIQRGGQVSPVPRALGIRSVIASSHFNSFVTALGRDTQAESIWADVESETIPNLRRFIAGSREAQHVDAVAEVMAIHLARSHGMVSLDARIMDSAASDQLLGLLQDETLQRMWHERHGSPLSEEHLRPQVELGIDVARQEHGTTLSPVMGLSGVHQ